VPVVWVITCSFLANASSISAAALFSLAPRTLQQEVLPYLFCFVIGTLHASALVDFPPQAIGKTSATPGLMIVITGLVLFEVSGEWRTGVPPAFPFSGADLPTDGWAAPEVTLSAQT
jgi:hypothetical protein